MRQERGLPGNQVQLRSSPPPFFADGGGAMRWTEFVKRVKGFFADALTRVGQWETGIPPQRNSKTLDCERLHQAPVAVPRVDFY